MSIDFQQPAVIYVHGCPGQFEDLNEEFRASKEFQIMNMLRPGFGKAALSKKSLSFDDHANLIVDFMDSHQIPSAILLGHSLGSAISLWTALKFPERVDGVVAVAPFFKAGKEEKRSTTPKILRLPIIGSIAAWIISKTAGKKSLEQNLMKSFGAERIDSDFVNSKVSQYAKPKTLIEILEEKNALLEASQKLDESLSQLQLPVVILSSDSDQIAAGQAAELAQKLSRASWTHSKRGGHLASQFSERDLSQAMSLILSKKEKKNAKASGL